MSKKKSKKFNAALKTKIVLELIKEGCTLSQLASKYEITGKSIQNWKRQFLENASLAFEPEQIVGTYKDEINELKGQNDELAKALGKTTVKRDWAVGKLNSLDISNKGSLVESKLNKLPKTRAVVNY